MDEKSHSQSQTQNLSWQVQLAKANINITGVQYNINHKSCVVCFEFPYHPKPGQTKWFKTADEFIGINISDKKSLEQIVENNELPVVYLHDLASSLKNKVLELRKELEG